MLDKVWSIASQFYHSEKEYNFFSEVVLNCIDTKSTSIIDVSCGTGFPVINMFQNGFANIYCADSYLPNVIFLKNELDKLGLDSLVKHVKFKELPTMFTQRFNVVFSIGSSITYCESWDEQINQVSNSRNEIMDSIQGMTDIVKAEGRLIIGLSNLYDKGKAFDSIKFPEKIIKGLPYSMNWRIDYDWVNLKKSWLSSIFLNGQLLYETKLSSHLITTNEIKEICSRLFYEVIIVSNPNWSSENYVICKAKY